MICDEMIFAFRRSSRPTPIAPTITPTAASSCTLSHWHRPLTVVESVHVPSPWMRGHVPPLPDAGRMHSIVGLVVIAGPPICSKHTSPLGHAHAAVVVPEPEPEPEPCPDFDSHAP